MAAELLDRIGWAWIRRFGDVLGPSASLVGTTVVTSVLGFAYWWAAARMAPIHEVGAATAVISAVTLLGTIGMFGFGTMLIAEAARCRAVGSLIATSLLAVTVLATGLAAVSWAVLRFSHNDVGAAMAPPWVAAGFIVGVGLTAAGMVLDQALVGIRASSVQFYRNSYFSVVKLGLLGLLAVAVGSHSPVTMVWAWVAGIAISMVATAGHLAARRYRLGQPVRLSALQGRGVTTFHHNTLNLSLALPRLGLPLLVASLLGTHASASFYEAWLIASFLYILPTHLSTALFAVAVGDARALAPRLRAALRVSLLFGGSVAVAIAALAGPTMRSFGPGYEIARTALVVMAIAYFPNVFKQCYVAVARVDNKLRKAGAVCSAGAALELCLTGVAGWFDGLTGISLGFLAAVTLQAIYYVPQVLRALRPAGQRTAWGRSSPARSQRARSSAPSPGRAGAVAASAGPGKPGTLCRREMGSLVVPGKSPWGEVAQPRVFIDHSGYDLLNIGDTAMLKATVTRLRDRWPGARLEIITTSRERLAALCPGTDPIILIPDRGPVGLLPGRVRGGISLHYKRAICACPWAAWRFSPGAGRLLDALRGCDLAVCSGGGFVNDSFPLHAAGVLAAMRSTQRRGVLTAMLGQGYGPLTSRPLAELASTVIPQLNLISLRGPHGQQAVPGLRGRRGEPVVTGDDALELAGAGQLAAGPALGVNLRAAAYTRLESGLAGQIASVVAAAAAEAGMPMRGLPISWHRDGEDWRALAGAFGADSAVARTGRLVRDITSLAAAVADCRIVVTSSYHAAVFALARGIPAVGISSTPYYDGKFGGLRELYGPRAVSVLAVSQAGWPDRMRSLVRAGVELDCGARAAVAERSAELASMSRGAYEALFELVESRWDGQGHRDDDHRGGLVLGAGRPVWPRFQKPAL